MNFILIDGRGANLFWKAIVPKAKPGSNNHRTCGFSGGPESLVLNFCLFLFVCLLDELIGRLSAPAHAYAAASGQFKLTALTTLVKRQCAEAKDLRART